MSQYPALGHVLGYVWEVFGNSGTCLGIIFWDVVWEVSDYGTCLGFFWYYFGTYFGTLLAYFGTVFGISQLLSGICFMGQFPNCECWDTDWEVFGT